jgi:urea carboxylase
MFTKVLIANRGEIACRIIRTLDRMGIESVAVYSEADAHSLHVRMAKQAVCIGPPQVAESYLRADRILQAALATGAQAIHPGYGFLSESTAFAAACEQAGLRFVGPTPEQLRRFGLKHQARALASQLGVPLLPGSDLLTTLDDARFAARRIGYPVMLKSTSGGGGIGLRVCRDPKALDEGFESVKRLSQSHFEGSGVFLEKFLSMARHIEVQIFGDGRGQVLALGERDCSVQRRNQKLVEETPAPGLRQDVREALFAAATRLGTAVQYASAGTVEFVFDAESDQFYFLEVNTRLQVEHGVTEAVTGIDLVEWMLQEAAGELSLPESLPEPSGAAIEVRLYAEDPRKAFLPSTGTLTHVAQPANARWDGWVESGTEITPHYDPLLAKLIVRGASRSDALRELRSALDATVLAGIEGNLDYLRQLARDNGFANGGVTTSYLARFVYRPRSIDVIAPGTQTTVQDYPGRVGYWSVGVPPSGPVDDYAFRFANRLVGNDAGAPGLEATLAGPTLQFNCDTVIAVTGADMNAKLDGRPIAPWRAHSARRGAVLEMGVATGYGFRAYLAMRGGLDVPHYLGSRSTFMLGGFGGHAGRALRAGDVLRLAASDADEGGDASAELPAALVPRYPEVWEIGVLYGPHGAPDFFTPDDIEAFWGSHWQVHHNSDRTGIRLIGPKPKWARKDGGEAGLHPSNIHDNAYAVGAVDYTGDMPVILGPDGPSLGGFVCPVTIVKAERWKMGQLKPGDRLRFKRMTLADANALASRREAEVASLLAPDVLRPPSHPPAAFARVPREQPAEDAIVGEYAQSAKHARLVFRRAGDEYLLVEFGPLELDLALRFQVHTFMTALQARDLEGIVDLTPGVRSLQVHYVPEILSLDRLMALLAQLARELPSTEEIVVPTRVVHLPMSWEDPATLLAIEKYTRVVRKDAPWCPSNIEFIRRINGLSSVDDVHRIVFGASYLVLGLGDVYLGAPVATPVDPRHRLVTTKYNPARTWTPENAVGIGGAYMCIYGMEGPGGYQFVGRTLQVWNTYRTTQEFAPDQPWLLRFFDQVRFYPVSASELLEMRAAFPQGKLSLRIDEETFDFARYRQFLADNAASIAEFKLTQAAAFHAERERWAAAGQDVTTQESLPETPPLASSDLPPGHQAVQSPVAGNLWKILVAVGDQVAAGATIAVVEAMKTEIAVHATAAGCVTTVPVRDGSAIAPGQTLVVLRTD